MTLKSCAYGTVQRRPVAFVASVVVYSGGAGPLQGIWKVHPDGSGAVLLSGACNGVPEASPTGLWEIGRAHV